MSRWDDLITKQNNTTKKICRSYRSIGSRVCMLLLLTLLFFFSFSCSDALKIFVTSAVMTRSIYISDSFDIIHLIVWSGIAQCMRMYEGRRNETELSVVFLRSFKITFGLSFIPAPVSKFHVKYH